MCGKLKGLKEIIAEGRMDGIDSVCPPTTGDLWAHEAISAWKDKIIIGGLEPVKLERSTIAETKKYVLDVLKKAAPCKNFILSTGDATAYGTPLENLVAVTQTVEKYGRFPVIGEEYL